MLANKSKQDSVIITLLPQKCHVLVTSWQASHYQDCPHRPQLGRRQFWRPTWGQAKLGELPLRQEQLNHAELRQTRGCQRRGKVQQPLLDQEPPRQSRRRRGRPQLQLPEGREAKLQ